MAFANFNTHQIHCKILYCGPKDAGKTSNLRSILTRTSTDIVHGSMELAPPAFTTPSLIEFLPLSVGRIKNHHLKVHLYTLPPSYLYPSFYSVLMKGLDGLIFVADSSPYRLAANIDAWQHTQQLLQQEGLLLSEIPAVVQYNKRDLRDALPVDVLKHHLNTLALPDLETCAHTGEGVMDTLHTVVSAFAQQMLQQAPSMHTPSSSPHLSL